MATGVVMGDDNSSPTRAGELTQANPDRLEPDGQHCAQNVATMTCINSQTKDKCPTDNPCKSLGASQDSNSSTKPHNDSSCSHGLQSVSEDGGNAVPQLSKRRKKRLEKKLKKQQYLKDKRQEERKKKKQQLKDKRAQGLDTGPSRKRLKMNTMERSACKIKVVADCSFGDLMTEKDIKSVVKQLNFCYAANRRAPDPLQFYITSFSGELKNIMDSIGHHVHWNVHIHPEPYQDIFDKSQIVYLSSDSKNVLHKLEDDKVYIIGGLVDHNHHKGLCLELAEKNGFSHAQLPIGDYVSLETRTTLTVNHVFEILLRFTETGDWEEAFYKVIPKRKGLVPVCTSDKSPASSHQQCNDNKPSSSSAADNDISLTGIDKESSLHSPGADIISTNKTPSDCDKSQGVNIDPDVELPVTDTFKQSDDMSGSDIQCDKDNDYTSDDVDSGVDSLVVTACDKNVGHSTS